jgi:hypothetical protein
MRVINVQDVEWVCLRSVPVFVNAACHVEMLHIKVILCLPMCTINNSSMRCPGIWLEKSQIWPKHVVTYRVSVVETASGSVMVSNDT